jgi:hypothetical protein
MPSDLRNLKRPDAKAPSAPANGGQRAEHGFVFDEQHTLARTVTLDGLDVGGLGIRA